MLLRTFRTSFMIEILPLNDNPPVIRLFTVDDCSANSVMAAASKKRRNTPQQSKKIRDRSKTQLEHHRVSNINMHMYVYYTVVICIYCSCRLISG